MHLFRGIRARGSSSSARTRSDSVSFRVRARLPNAANYSSLTLVPTDLMRSVGSQNTA